MCIHFMSTVANRIIGQAAVDQLKSPALKSALTEALSRRNESIHLVKVRYSETKDYIQGKAPTICHMISGLARRWGPKGTLAGWHHWGRVWSQYDHRVVARPECWRDQSDLLIVNVVILWFTMYTVVEAYIMQRFTWEILPQWLLVRISICWQLFEKPLLHLGIHCWGKSRNLPYFPFLAETTSLYHYQLDMANRCAMLCYQQCSTCWGE